MKKCLLVDQSRAAQPVEGEGNDRDETEEGVARGQRVAVRQRPKLRPALPRERHSGLAPLGEPATLIVSAHGHSWILSRRAPTFPQLGVAPSSRIAAIPDRDRRERLFLTR